MIGFLRSLICFFRPSCRSFQGDAYTRWVQEQGQASRQSRRELREARDPITRTIRGDQ